MKKNQASIYENVCLTHLCLEYIKYFHNKKKNNPNQNRQKT